MPLPILNIKLPGVFTAKTKFEGKRRRIEEVSEEDATPKKNDENLGSRFKTPPKQMDSVINVASKLEAPPKMMNSGIDSTASLSTEFGNIRATDMPMDSGTNRADSSLNSGLDLAINTEKGINCIKSKTSMNLENNSNTGMDLENNLKKGLDLEVTSKTMMNLENISKKPMNLENDPITPMNLENISNTTMNLEIISKTTMNLENDSKAEAKPEVIKKNSPVRNVIDISSGSESDDDTYLLNKKCNLIEEMMREGKNPDEIRKVLIEEGILN